MPETIEKKCDYCDKVFLYKKYPSHKDEKNRGRFCSRSCIFRWHHHNKVWDLHISRTHYPDKGEDAGYHAKHKWIAAQMGAPSVCEHCGTTEAPRFHWASTDHKYRKNLWEWMRLCAKCHYKYDGRERMKNDKGQYSN